MPEEVLETPAAAQVDPDTLSNQDYRTLRETGKAPEAVPTTSAASKEAEIVPDSETGETDQEKPKQKKGGFQKRIDKLTRQNADLEARLAGNTAAKPAEKVAEPAKPAAEGKPQAKDFETYEAFIETLTDWKADQRDQAKSKVAADAKAATDAKTAGDKWNKQLTEARTRYEDYDEVALSDAPISQAVHNAIVGSEQGADLAYYLGQNPVERERINALKPIAATMALGKILAALEAQAGEDPDDEKPKVSAAPAPIKPVGTKSATAGKRAEDMSGDEYRKARESGKLR